MKRFETAIEYAFIVLAFIVGANLFVYLKTSGLNDLGALFQNVNISYKLTEVYTEVTLLGLVLGLQIIGLQSKVMPYLYRRTVLYKFLWSLIMIILVLINGMCIHFLYSSLWLELDSTLAWSYSVQFVTTDIFLSFTIYFFMIGVLVSFLRQLRYNFGEAVFYNFILGKYNTPKEEERSFLFIDLNNSTHIAEELGHTKYSRFLNCCFNDILEACKPYDFEVYQYVGDEIILTWLPKNDNNGKAIAIFESITKHLFLVRLKYQDKFSIIPTFKASAHTGKVASTIVGRRNQTFAYHGDVLNTAARLLELCKGYRKDLLFTKAYLDSLSQPCGFIPKFLTSLKLRGKGHYSYIYHIVY